jgi:hypothetical protein
VLHDVIIGDSLPISVSFTHWLNVLLNNLLQLMMTGAKAILMKNSEDDKNFFYDSSLFLLFLSAPQ